MLEGRRGREDPKTEDPKTTDLKNGATERTEKTETTVGIDRTLHSAAGRARSAREGGRAIRTHKRLMCCRPLVGPDRSPTLQPGLRPGASGGPGEPGESSGVSVSFVRSVAPF
jgi:hypothetical protein